ncbi:metaxin 1 [Podochytrium sp. JEL0797]|nr:metaxin 1 [Podochytrium sp. JEL0797]
MSPPPFELFSWGPAWGLSSFDPFCMSIQCYLSLSCVNWISTKSSNPGISPSGELPLLRDSTIPVAGTANIIRHLKRKGYDLDANLTPLQIARSSSYITLIETKLYEARLHTLFMDAKNYSEDTLRVYSKQLDFMRRFYFPEILKKRVVGRLAGYRMMLDDNQELVNEVYLNAKDVFQALSSKLGDQLFFFGEKPTTLDAIAYAHLTLFALPILSNPKLNAILTFHFPNLTAYITRMQNTMTLYPPPTPSPSPPPLHIVSFLTNPTASFAALYAATKIRLTALTTTPEPVSSGDPEADQAELRKREARVDAFYKWSSVIGAVAFFVGYVIANGIVQIDFGEEEANEAEVVDGRKEDEEGDGFDGTASVYVDEDGNVYSDEDEEE